MVTQARQCIKSAESDWGRKSSEFDQWVLDVSQADAELASSSGGLVGEAHRLYSQVLATIESSNSVEDVLLHVLRSKCFSGLVSLALRSTDNQTPILAPSVGTIEPEELARKNLDSLLSLGVDGALPSLFVWNSVEATRYSIRFLIANARQQVADCLQRKGSTAEAIAFLEDAVRASPEDAIAALSLGVFRLRSMFWGENRSLDVAKAAQIQLLKAAKLDSSKSSPFALLGYWYEFARDEKRALGCYSKALLLDPSHSVAGRGLLRLQDSETLLPLLEKATDTGSAMSGWAWRGIGVHKAMVEGSDDLAVVSFLQALRSRDVRNPKSDPLSDFFSSPFSPKVADKREFVDTTCDLASCYRRLGRFTASLRSYYAALEAAGAEPSGSILSACAQGEFNRPIDEVYGTHKLTVVPLCS